MSSSGIIKNTDDTIFKECLEKCNKHCFSDVESNFTSVSQAQTPSLGNNIFKCESNNYTSQCDQADTNESTSTSESFSTTSKNNNSLLNTSSSEHKSNESFFKVAEGNANKIGGVSINDSLISKWKTFRIFNKRGKPLTDRMGRALVNIFGDPLVVFDDKGRLISDSKGNQIFNCYGESAINSKTDLHASPSIEEPGIPLLDIDKKHILFLYDSNGHPMTDTLGRPLLKASGKRMFGMNSTDIINIIDNRANNMKSIYGKAPLEDFVRRIQIFDADLKPLTDENGNQFETGKIICNKDGMPMSDNIGRPLLYKYGDRVFTPQKKVMSRSCLEDTTSVTSEEIPLHLKSNPQEIKKENHLETSSLLTETNIVDQVGSEMQDKPYHNEIPLLSTPNQHESDDLKYESNKPKDTGNPKIYAHYNNTLENSKCIKTYNSNEGMTQSQQIFHIPPPKNEAQEEAVKNTLSSNSLTHLKCTQSEINSKHEKNNKSPDSKEAIILFDASKKFENKQSSFTTVGLKDFRGMQKHNALSKRNPNKIAYTSNFIRYVKNTFNLSTPMKTSDQNPSYNNYGKPVRDIYGNLMYDKFGIPLTGACGIRLDGKARYALREKLKNTPVMPISHQKLSGSNGFRGEFHNQFGEPFNDKFGRPLYDLFGRLIYDFYGRPLTDAFDRPLIDAVGQPLMDSKGHVLTSVSRSPSKTRLTDIFGRQIYDNKGRSLFDSYGRPRFDIFTNAIYDNCGRPAKDENDNVLFDFLNKPIQQYPEKPLYKNARAMLPRYIDKILEMPSMYRVLKFSRTSLKDLFGGPLFDDYGRPLYNKNGKPLYDKYGRPLYNKDGQPLCDCYGRPLSEEVRKSTNDQTISVIDSLKLLKLTNESSQWMEIKRSEMKGLTPLNYHSKNTFGKDYVSI